jgi:hypothetical protein
MVLRLVPDEEHADGAFIGSGLRRRRQAKHTGEKEENDEELRREFHRE